MISVGPRASRQTRPPWCPRHEGRALDLGSPSGASAVSRILESAMKEPARWATVVHQVRPAPRKSRPPCFVDPRAKLQVVRGSARRLAAPGPTQCGSRHTHLRARCLHFLQVVGVSVLAIWHSTLEGCCRKTGRWQGERRLTLELSCKPGPESGPDHSDFRIGKNVIGAGLRVGAILGLQESCQRDCQLQRLVRRRVSGWHT